MFNNSNLTQEQYDYVRSVSKHHNTGDDQMDALFELLAISKKELAEGKGMSVEEVIENLRSERKTNGQ